AHGREEIGSETAGDAKDGAGGVRGVGAEQEGDGRRDLLGLAGAAEWDAAGGLVRPVRCSGVRVDLGADDAGRDGVDPDAVAGELLRQAEGEDVDTGLCRGVVQILVRRSGGAGGRGDVDYRAAMTSAAGR